ncbi:MAG: sensor histidine kinase, partial [Chloroflexi bacterium]|nr:sensor histidine kinase [Chloroflexota bacterium]
EDAPITIAVRAVTPPHGAREMHLAIADPGIGIPANEQERIFDKFYRVAGAGRRTHGTGMGLAIVKGLVEANGGHVEVESRPGRGSTFTVVLPVEEMTGDEARPAVPSALGKPPR